jgi:4-hydroxy-tetrahydrodipicolinate reductase
MNIALIGYGKLGKEIETVALERGHTIGQKVTIEEAQTYQLDGCDMAIECTGPESAVDNIRKCLKAGVPVVVGSTGWYAHFEEIKREIETRQASLVYATNFSIGVHLFWKANRYLAGLMRKFNDYNVAITEIHHTEKKDAPSGTAISTAEILMEESETRKHWKLVNEGETAPGDAIGITALREGDAKGMHVVSYESAVDRIELSHEAFSRKGFAHGAVLAAEFLQNKKGLYSMKDVLEDYIK